MMKTLIALALVLAGTLAHADVLVVNIWNPMPGRMPATIQAAKEAKAIHEKLGATVVTAVAVDGRLHYAMSFDNWQGYATFAAKLGADKDWAAWEERTNADPAAVREDTYLLNVPSPAPVGRVYSVYIWEPMMGRTGALVEAAMQAKAIHEKAGATVAINVDQLQRVHYVMSFPSLEAWAKFQDTPNEEFARFMQEQMKNPAGTLVKVYNASQI